MTGKFIIGKYQSFCSSSCVGQHLFFSFRFFSAKSEKNWIVAMCAESGRPQSPDHHRIYALNEFRVNLCNNYVHRIYIIWLEFYARALSLSRLALHVYAQGCCALSPHERIHCPNTYVWLLCSAGDIGHRPIGQHYVYRYAREFFSITQTK